MHIQITGHWRVVIVNSAPPNTD